MDSKIIPPRPCPYLCPCPCPCLCDMPRRSFSLSASKTNQSHVGVEIYLAHSPLSPLCPVTVLRTLFTCYSTQRHAPLFIRPFNQPFVKSFSFLQCIICFSTLAFQPLVSLDILYARAPLLLQHLQTWHQASRTLEKRCCGYIHWQTSKTRSYSKNPPPQCPASLPYSLTSLASSTVMQSSLSILVSTSCDHHLACRDLQRVATRYKSVTFSSELHSIW